MKNTEKVNPVRPPHGCPVSAAPELFAGLEALEAITSGALKALRKGRAILAVAIAKP